MKIIIMFMNIIITGQVDVGKEDTRVENGASIIYDKKKLLEKA